MTTLHAIIIANVACAIFNSVGMVFTSLASDWMYREKINFGLWHIAICDAALWITVFAAVLR